MSPWTIAALFAGAAFACAFVVIERRSSDPLLPIGMLRNPWLQRACIGTLELSDVEASAIGARLAAFMLGPQISTTRGHTITRERLDSKTLTQVVDYVESRLTESMTVLELATVSGLSLFHFTRAFRNTVGMPPHQFVIGRRLERAKRLLVSTNMIVEDIAWSLGFENLGHFRRKFHSQFGTTPGRLRVLR